MATLDKEHATTSLTRPQKRHKTDADSSVLLRLNDELLLRILSFYAPRTWSRALKLLSSIDNVITLITIIVSLLVRVLLFKILQHAREILSNG